MIRGMHHVAIICSDYERSKRFYVETLGLAVVAETYRTERGSWKLDLALADGVQVEVFRLPSSPPRVTRPEACGLRHLALRVDELTGARLTFLQIRMGCRWRWWGQRAEGVVPRAEGVC